MQARTVLVVDGLDQHDSTKHTLALLQYLLSWVYDFPWLYLFLTLRPHAYIMAAFARSGHSHLVHERRLEVAPRVGAHPNPRTSFAVVLPRDPTGQPIPLDTFYKRILDWGYQHKGRRRVFVVLECVAIEDIASMTLEAILAYANAHSAYATTPLSFLDIVSTVHRLRSVLVMNAKSEVLARDTSFHDFLLDGERYADRPLLVSRPLTLACACLAVINDDRDVAAMLRWGPYPPPSSPPHRLRRPSVARLALFLWPRYVLDVSHSDHRDKMLMRQLEAFVPSTQLAMYAWVTTPRQAVRAGKALVRYLLPCEPSGAATCGHFFKFVCFVHIYRDSQSPPHSCVAPAYLMQAIRRTYRGEGGEGDCTVTRQGPAALCFELGGPDPALRFNVTVKPDDMARYWDIMKNFRQQLRDTLADHSGSSFPESILSGAYRIADEDN
ncbi:hypothetical protein PsYK624_161790 [Phanerochaete sordida]|uniref:Uncharacterized protein n=1 Tax=Phanerochaete sordida TaxID=48140 RepID=A0A9P3GVE1_9APHY|nr:hypothetical protein PsYK624_161790 [Phanerochaete sordida]